MSSSHMGISFFNKRRSSRILDNKINFDFHRYTSASMSEITGPKMYSVLYRTYESSYRLHPLLFYFKTERRERDLATAR